LRTIHVAPPLVDYVLAHERIHLEMPRHDADADARRAALRLAGARVSW
jgi:hypothetical protein